MKSEILNRDRKLKIFIFLLLMLIASTIQPSIAQTIPLVAKENLSNVFSAQIFWEKTYGGPADDRAFWAVQDNSNFLVVGSTKSVISNVTAGYAIMLDEYGNELWNKTYLQELGTELRYALSLTDGFLLVGNEFLKSGDTNGYVAKIDRQGTVIWNTTIGGEKTDRFFSATLAQDGFVLLGLTYSYGNGESDAWITKIDFNGNVVWNKVYKNSFDTAGRSGALAPDGGIVIAGYANSEDVNYNFLILKIDASGNVVWSQSYGGGGSQKAYSITRASCGYVIVGDTQSPESDIDAWVIKVDWNGTLLWAKAIGGQAADSASSVALAEDGYLIGGFTFSFGAGNRDFWLFKVSETGRVLWSCTQGDAAFQEAYRVLEVSKNEYLLVGWTDPSGLPDLVGKAQYDFCVVKLNGFQEGEDTFDFQVVACAIVIAAFAIFLSVLLLKFGTKRA